MLATETREIDGLKYTVTQLGAKKGLKVLTRLLRLLSFNTPDSNFFQAIREEDMEYFCDAFIPCTSVEIDGKVPQLSAIFELHFQARYGALAKWLAFCIEVNYRSFFAEMSQGEGALKDLMGGKVG